MSADPVPAALSVCLFCGSSNVTDPRYLEGAAEFGRTLAAQGVRLVYGGGGVGLMGQAAKAAHGAGGQVFGVIPAFLRKQEVIYDEVDTVVVQTMHQSKQMMFDASDAFAVFPGGIGTLEEVVELMSWRRLSLHDKPIVFLDMDGFWRPFFDLIDHTIAKRLTPDWMPSTYVRVETVAEVMPAIRQALREPRPGGEAHVHNLA
jgi:uncharacterized protein (TIGR00730 family)